MEPLFVLYTMWYCDITDIWDEFNNPGVRVIQWQSTLQNAFHTDTATLLALGRNMTFLGRLFVRSTSAMTHPINFFSEMASIIDPLRRSIQELHIEFLEKSHRAPVSRYADSFRRRSTRTSAQLAWPICG